MRLRRTAPALVTALILPTLAACGGDGTGPAGQPAQVRIVSGNDQEGVVGRELGAALVVRVVDAEGDPIPGQPVEFLVTAGGGSVAAGSAVTDASGVAQARWTLGTSTVDAQEVEVRVVEAATGGPPVAATFSAVPLADAPAILSIIGGDGQEGPYATPLADPLAVRVLDRYDNGVPGVEVRWTTGDGDVDPASEATDMTGIATGAWTLAGSGTEQSARAEVDGLAAVEFTASGHTGWSQVSAGAGFTCALTTAGRAYCWGKNGTGALGTGDGENRLVPTPVTGEATYRTISAGNGFACAITLEDAAFCWGSDELGQLGNSLRVLNGVFSPARVTGGYTFRSVSAGRSAACAVTVEGSGYCWGSDADGQLGDGPAASSGCLANDTTICARPIPVAAGLEWQSLQASYRHACGVTPEGAAYCWGHGDEGRIGVGEVTEGCDGGACSTSPLPVLGGLRFDSVSTTGPSLSCGVASGHAYCWGSNEDGQLGTGQGTGDATTPQPVAGDHAFAQLSAGLAHACGVDRAEQLYCWGRNASGQVGDGSKVVRPSPVPVGGDLEFRSVSAGADHSCGVTTTWAVYCWGGNAAGALGLGTTVESLVPAKVHEPAG